jgi:hypothetical protein
VGVRGVTPVRQRRLEPLTNAISQLANAELTVASVIANFHHQRIIPLMERELLIFEMSDTANPVSLASLWLLEEPLAQGYAATVSLAPAVARRAAHPGVRGHSCEACSESQGGAA